MDFFDSVLLGVALAMDCFSVSITCGIIQQRMGRQVLGMALLFGVAQALMPLFGWLLAGLFRQQIEAYDHWVAFFLLLFIGGRMIWDGMHPERERHICPSKPSTLLVLAVATSIDALAVGFSFISFGIRTLHDVLRPLLVIGGVTMLCTFLGKYVGIRVGRRFDWPTEQVGGVILILIGTKVLLEHLYGW